MVRTDQPFGTWLRERRKSRDWTQATLAAQMTEAGFAVTRNWVNRVEGGAIASDDFHRAAESLFGRYDPPIVAGLGGGDTVTPGLAALVSVLIDEQRETRAM